MNTRVCVAFDVLAASVVARHNPDHPALARADELAEFAVDAHDVCRALASKGCEPSLLPVGDDAFAAMAKIVNERPDLVFDLCDTLRGRSDLAVALPALCELSGIAVAGASSRGMALSKRKHDVKAALARLGVPTPRYQVVDHPSQLVSFRLDLVPPVIVKPTTEHASIGIAQASLAFDAEGVARRVRWLFERGMGPALVEEYVDGEELSVLVFGEPPRACAPVSYDFGALPEGYPRVRTFDLKWFSDPSIAGERPSADPRARLPIPVRAPAAKAAMDDLGAAAIAAFGAGGCRDWGRVDFRRDAGGVPLVIDVTPNAYLAAASSSAESAAACGVEYRDLVRIIVDSALARGSGS